MRGVSHELDERGGVVMTIGALSRRTGVSVQLIREYEDAGLIYSLDRSEGNYRLRPSLSTTCSTPTGRSALARTETGLDSHPGGRP